MLADRVRVLIRVWLKVCHNIVDQLSDKCFLAYLLQHKMMSKIFIEDFNVRKRALRIVLTECCTPKILRNNVVHGDMDPTTYIEL